MLKRYSILLLLLITCVAAAQAFVFEPINQDYAPSGKNSNHIFRVANPGTEKIAVKISIRPRYLEPDGTEIQGEVSDLFSVYPKQILLEPNESRSIRVKWIGDAEPAVELPFRIIAQEVPVSFTQTHPAEGASIRLTYRYEGNIYIIPWGAKAKLGIKSMKREAETETVTETVMETVVLEQENGEEVESVIEKLVETEVKQEFLVFEIENSGTMHTMLNRIELKLKRDQNDTQPIILKDEDLKGVAGENMLAESVRIFRIPMPAGIWDGPVYGSIKQVPAK
ncbi:MAG: hypothetical protein PQJ61_08165 [Spirochaetales bacterium]|uniref:Pili assembly chaperone N-terminal domain-containing protein n=1 Tax=Candidatus Thalassospirochaeta sargassi TaxID=3119039 RepID=A0AAJ1IG66_9SPIO|nr:hypothetical protein [Spirochaetales bacterium]